MKIRDLEIIKYSAAYELQEQIAEKVYKDFSEETLLLLEHYPVYTIGRGGNQTNILDRTIEAIRISRGGDVTYHGPGQLVGYPIISLMRRGKDLRLYLRFLEELLISVAADFGVFSFRLPGRTGVWTDEGKLAAIGVGVRHWVTMHGFALNVSTDLSAFNNINPCGITDCPIVSLAAICGFPISMAEVKLKVAKHFEKLLDVWMPSETEYFK
jgi:lipoyl(octanoyl) transferase